MKRFAFRLERLLQLRVAAEKERARELAEALTEEETRRGALREGAARLAEAREQLSGTTAIGRPRAGSLRNLELSLLALLTNAAQLSARHEKSLERVDSERQQYELARRERRILERLRQQRRQTWEGEYQRWEQAITDEVALNRSRGEPEDRP